MHIMQGVCDLLEMLVEEERGWCAASSALSGPRHLQAFWLFFPKVSLTTHLTFYPVVAVNAYHNMVFCHTVWIPS